MISHSSKIGPWLSLLVLISACVTQIPVSPSATPQPTIAIQAATASPTSTPVRTSTVTLESTPPSVTKLPDPTNYFWLKVQSGLDRPVDLETAADGSARLFILEQAGMIRVMKNDKIQAAPFLDIRDRVGRNGNERGLLGIAFHPDFKTNGFFYVDYTNLNGNTVISRFSVPAGGQNADTGSEQVLLKIAQPFANHNGGRVVFGPDGMLWIGMGDGGSQGDPNGNGQSLQTLLGKILRIDVDHGSPYTIPADNPFAAGGGEPEIWAYGVRNPWGLKFDVSTGELYIADVGQDAWEEINFIPAIQLTPPLNFGWSLMEGNHPYRGNGQPLPGDYVGPVYEYDHDQGCSVTGGAVYRGKELPAFYGVYLFGDYCSGTIWGMLHPDGQGWVANKLFQTSAKISSFGTDEVGELYMLDLNGALYRLEAK